MPSVNDGRSDMPDSGFAATSLLAGSPTSRIFGGLAFCSFSRLTLGLDLLRSFAFCLCGSLHLRDPGSFSLCLLGRFALDLHAPPSPPPRVARVRQPRSSLSQRLRALPASPPRARLFAQRRAPPSLPPRASPAARLRAGLSPRRHALLARLRLRDPWPLVWPLQQARQALRPCCLPP